MYIHLLVVILVCLVSYMRAEEDSYCSKYPYNKVRHNEGSWEGLPETCTCVPHCDSWTKPNPDREARCFFFDLGVEVAQSTLAFFGEGPEKSCRYGPLTHKVFDRNWFHNNICGWETEKVDKLLGSFVYPKLTEAGFKNSTQCKSILVEPSNHFTKLLHLMKTEYVREWTFEGYIYTPLVLSHSDYHHYTAQPLH